MQQVVINSVRNVCDCVHMRLHAFALAHTHHQERDFFQLVWNFFFIFSKFCMNVAMKWVLEDSDSV